jgi:hypothetical protein
VYVPLRQLAPCLDCDECFELGSPMCPACGSATWTSLSRFLAQSSSARHPGRRDVAAAQRHDDPLEIRQLIIVAGNPGSVFCAVGVRARRTGRTPRCATGKSLIRTIGVLRHFKQ